MAKDIHPSLGNKIRSLRLERNLKIIEVAKLTGLTSSLISQVEHSSTSPSIDTLRKIAQVLNISISSLFDESDDETITVDHTESVEPKNIVVEKTPVVRKNQRKILSPGKGVTYHLLNPDLSGPIEFIYNIYESGTGTGREQYTHEGHECGIILEGELVVTIGDKTYVLEEGDSITFSSSLPHSKTNKASARCVCIWANTPPYF